MSLTKLSFPVKESLVGDNPLGTGKPQTFLTLYGSSLGSYADISQKYKMGDKSKVVANSL
jgi:hypothetical protein